MNRGSVEVLFIQGVSGVITSWFSGTDYLKVALPTQKVSRAFEKRGPWNDWLIDWFCSTLWSTENSLDLSLTSSGGEENDEDVTFSEPPLDDEDDEPLTRPSSGFSPFPLPLTSTQKPLGQKLDDNQGDKKQSGTKQSIALESCGRSWLCCVLWKDNLLLIVFPPFFVVACVCSGKALNSMPLPFFVAFSFVREIMLMRGVCRKIFCRKTM